MLKIKIKKLKRGEKGRRRKDAQRTVESSRRVRWVVIANRTSHIARPNTARAYAGYRKSSKVARLPGCHHLYPTRIYPLSTPLSFLIVRPNSFLAWLSTNAVSFSVFRFPFSVLRTASNVGAPPELANIWPSACANCQLRVYPYRYTYMCILRVYLLRVYRR